MKKKLITLVIFLTTLLTFKSQAPINATLKETNFFPGSEPNGLLQIGNDLIFAANTGSGNEPHKYNLQTGTGGIIQNINGNFTNSLIKNQFYNLNNKAYYFASDNSNLQLWSTDLSTNLTSKIKDFNIDYYPSSNNMIAKVLNNKLYFVFQQKLHVSDGTTAGTFQISDINNVGNSLQENNGNIFFFGSNNIYGRELWKTDGTLAGTTIVKDINPGYNSSIGNERMYKFNNKIVFIATDNNLNLALWSTDGSASNTVSFYTLNNGYSIFYDYDVESYNGMFFTINGNLWKTDGTFNGTNLIYNNIPNINKLTHFKNKTYIDTNTNIYYVDQANQISILNNPSGTILQTIAPSSNGNYLALREYNNNTSKIYFFDDTNLLQSNIKFTLDNKFIEYQGKLLFSGYIDSYTDSYTTYKNTELFSYSPSSNISKIEKDMSNASHGTPRYYTELNGEVFFVARDGYYFQVYKIDSNNNLVKLSNDLQESFPDNFGDYNPVAVSGNYIYFHNNKLIRTGITANSTQQISPPINEKIYGTYPLNNDKILIKTFNTTDNHMRIWSLDNNASSFSLLIERPVNNFYSTLNVDYDFVKTDSGIYFKIINNSVAEIWKSNGTVATTVKVTDLYSIYGLNSFLGLLNNKIFFSDNQNFSYDNTKLYYIDEATNQVNFVKDSYYGINGKSFVKNNQLFFFSATNNGYMTALNATDGTPQNTQVITQINSEGAYAIKKCGNFNYFLDYQRQKLFRTDGTASGSILVTTGAQNYSALNCMNNEIYALNSMQKIFKTNGNSGNYQELSFKINNQVLQQPDYLWIKSLFARNLKIYFSIDQYQNHGEELFVTEEMNTLATHEENINSTDKAIIYPNPSTDYINIKVSNQERVLKVIIYDANGRLISIHNKSTLNIQALPAGIYFLNIITDLKKYNSKLIKK